MMLRRLLFLSVALTVTLAPLPLGSNRDWSWSPLAAIVGVLVIAQAITSLHPDVHAYRSFRALRVPAGLVAVVVAWGFAQAFGWTPTSWEHPIRIASAPDLPSTASHTVALEGEQAITGLMRLLTYVGVFILAADLSASSRDARRLYGIMVWSAVGYTIYSMVAEVANRLTIATGLTVPVPFVHSFSGPFINRNNYATYAAITALAALALAMRTIRLHWSAPGGVSVAERWRRSLTTLSGSGGLWLVAATILIMGVLFSGSRAGWASLAIGLVSMMALQARGVSGWTIGAATLLVLAALVLLLPTGNMMLTRYVNLMDLGEANRPYLFALTANAISQRPLLGWGANSFQSLFSVFQPAEVPAYFDKVHNTYLELAFDLGLPAAAALFFAVLWIVVRCFRGLAERRRDVELTALGVCTSITVGVHALFDFSLQIPAVSVVFSAMLGTAWARSWSSRRFE